jgi:hypothetical protein
MMPKWRVLVSYWCGFTGDEEWLERTRGVLEAQGWTDVRFGNRHTPNYVPFSSNVDGDEIEFIARGERPDPKAVERLIQQVGIKHVAYVTIHETQAE